MAEKNKVLRLLGEKHSIIRDSITEIANDAISKLEYEQQQYQHKILSEIKQKFISKFPFQTDYGVVYFSIDVHTYLYASKEFRPDFSGDMYFSNIEKQIEVVEQNKTSIINEIDNKFDKLKTSIILNGVTPNIIDDLLKLIEFNWVYSYNSKLSRLFKKEQIVKCDPK
jgi:hypothetical protein